MITEQWEFLRDVAKLIIYIETKGLCATGGELYRTQFQQDEYVRKNKSKTQNSQHLKRLAIDLHIFKDGKLITDVEEVREIGEYWMKLNPKNKAGMFWKFYDMSHFERIDNETNDKANIT